MTDSFALGIHGAPPVCSGEIGDLNFHTGNPGLARVVVTLFDRAGKMIDGLRRVFDGTNWVGQRGPMTIDVEYRGKRIAMRCATLLRAEGVTGHAGEPLTLEFESYPRYAFDLRPGQLAPTFY